MAEAVRQVMLIRSPAETVELRRLLKRRGVIAVALPAIERQSLTWSVQQIELLQQPRYYGLIVTSPNAAGAFFSQLRQHLGAVGAERWLRALRLSFAVGEATAKVLAKGGVRQVIYPQVQRGSESLLELIVGNVTLLHELQMILPIAAGEGDEILDTLRPLRVSIERLAVYKTAPRAMQSVELLPLRRGEIKALVFFSPSGVRGLVAGLTTQNCLTPGRKPIAIAFGAKTANALKENGFFDIRQVDQSTQNALVAKIIATVL